MYQAYKFRIYPTTEQQTYFAGAFGCCRWFWNYSLNLCQQTYKDTGKGLSRSAIQGLLPNLKKEFPWLTNAYSQSLQVVALNLSTAYKNFFDKRGGFPGFKSKHGRQSISYPQNVKVGTSFIKLPIIGEVHCVIHRQLDGTVKTVTISKNTDGKYYNCLHKVSEMPLNLRHWDCPKCHSRNDRDINAAKNIRDEALRIIALGTSASANGRNVSQPGKTSVLLDAVPVEVGSPRHSVLA